uniref:Saposin B-type domain-containing protein n=1 Tax=Cryptomonas curvata TaxID=233186 RepID=A0A7S0MB68_9CRYP|mmetsp:Transcript_33144/g.69381  ORF Transcript_33144/g.69381 Transcript_33144/m.69381 type:complete len:194 (+) Transcript_33144:645-1226(+)
MLQAVAMNMCVDLGMCNEMTASPACHVCDGLVKKIQVAISAPTSYFVEFFRGLIEQSICGSLESGAAACKDAAAGAAARAWSGAVSGLAPGKACRSCGSRAAAAAAGEGLVCHVCEKLALFIDSDVLEDPAVQKAVADQLKDLCAQLPNPRITNSSITAQCDKMVDENTAEIMSQVGKAVQARLCEDLVLCAA